MQDKTNESGGFGSALLGICRAAETGSNAIVGGVSLIWRAFTSVVKFGMLLALVIMALRFIAWMMAQ